jgi:hypothetical protein
MSYDANSWSYKTDMRSTKTDIKLNAGNESKMLDDKWFNKVINLTTQKPTRIS